MIYFTADTHFGSDRLISDGFRRHFKSAEEQDAKLIEVWNSVVSEEDVVFMLGDFMGVADEDKFRWVAHQLKGKKILLLGNNDIWLRYRPELANEYFVRVEDYIEFKVGPVALTLTHYPLQTWNKSGVGAIAIHGHIHKEGLRFLIDDDYRPRMNRFCCCSDMWEHRPVTLTDMINRWPERFMPLDVSEHYPAEMPEVEWDMVFGSDGKITPDMFRSLELKICFLDKCEVSPVKESLEYFSRSNTGYWYGWELQEKHRGVRDFAPVYNLLAERMPVK